MRCKLADFGKLTHPEVADQHDIGGVACLNAASQAVLPTPTAQPKPEKRISMRAEGLSEPE